MRCPFCGTSHPSSYEQCVSCGQAFYQEQEIEPADQNIETAPQSANQALDEGAVLVSQKPKERHDINRNGASWSLIKLHQ
ncbi:MAG: hypothetical protein IPJ49_00665 [Candidatus Obscuribacter sp.]|nr:hypothetical protein [Candidatus Obscuribacter sp.]